MIPHIVRRYPVWTVFALAIAAATLLGLGAEALAEAAQPGPRERALFVGAVDSRGEPVEGLSVNDFIVTEDGRRREVLRVSRAIEPMDIALLVDNSAAADNAISSLRTALGKFVAKMAEGNQITVIGLAARPTVLVDYTSNARQLE